MSFPLPLIVLLLLLSAAIVAVGLRMRHRGHLRSRTAVTLWALLCLLPLFGTGLAVFTSDQIGLATGETKTGAGIVDD